MILTNINIFYTKIHKNFILRVTTYYHIQIILLSVALTFLLKNKQIK